MHAIKNITTFPTVSKNNPNEFSYILLNGFLWSQFLTNEIVLKEREVVIMYISIVNRLKKFKEFVKKKK